MNLFGLYRTLRENQEKKNNFLATVVEGPDSGGRLLFSEGQLKSVYGDISLTPEQQEYLTEAGQSQLTGMENRKFCGTSETSGTSGDLRRRACFPAGAASCQKCGIFCDSYR